MKIVLAYSGGLDTSIAVPWLKETYDAEIIAFCANLGQFESLDAVEDKAKQSGASKVIIKDLREEYLNEYAFKALQANAAYQGQYLLAAPLGRPLIAKHMVEIAHAENANAVAHGATGKGNDQARFVNSIVTHDPNIDIIQPVMEWEMSSRDDQIEYAKKLNVAIPITKEKPYSIDTNIWGTSIECGVLDDYSKVPPEEIYQITDSIYDCPDISTNIEIEFLNGVPIKLNGKPIGSVELVTKLNKVGGENSVGRIDIMEDRLVGIKTRGVYESPAATILYKAHQELESLVLDRDTLSYKKGMEKQYAELTYNGLWFSPLKKAMDSFIATTQLEVNGKVTLSVYKGNIVVLSKKSENALYNHVLSTYDNKNAFSQDAGVGFCYIHSMPARVLSLRDKENLKTSVL